MTSEREGSVTQLFSSYWEVLATKTLYTKRFICVDKILFNYKIDKQFILYCNIYLFVFYLLFLFFSSGDDFYFFLYILFVEFFVIQQLNSISYNVKPTVRPKRRKFNSKTLLLPYDFSSLQQYTHRLIKGALV